MNWPEALEIVAARPAHERFRELCADDWPDHAAYRVLVVQLALGKDEGGRMKDEDDKLRAFVQRHGCCG
jgi:hypothetical protein